MSIEFGAHTFAAVPVVDGRPMSHAQVLRDVVAEGVAADRAGLSFFGIGEHHRDDFAASAPEIMLGALATATERIRPRIRAHPSGEGRPQGDRAAHAGVARRERAGHAHSLRRCQPHARVGGAPTRRCRGR